MANDNSSELDEDKNEDDLEEGHENQDDEGSDADQPNYKALFEDSEKKRKKLKRQLYSKKADEEEDQDVSINTSSDSKWKQRMELKVEGYNDEEVDFIIKNGGRKALETPYIKKTIEVMREQRTAEKAMIDDDSSKSSPEKRVSAESFSKLSGEEQLKVLSEIK